MGVQLQEVAYRPRMIASWRDMRARSWCFETLRRNLDGTGRMTYSDIKAAKDRAAVQNALDRFCVARGISNDVERTHYERLACIALTCGSTTADAILDDLTLAAAFHSYRH